MQGIILAGGLGTRLHPLTQVVNKHLLPIYDKPMICYPLKNLTDAGIKDVIIVSNAPDIMKFLKSGKEYGLDSLSYVYQEGAGGIADALMCAAKSITKLKIAVILGDNFFSEKLDFNSFVKGGKIFLKKVRDPKRYGVAEIKDKEVIGIEEKPNSPKSNYAVTGLYLYDHNVFNIIPTINPSARGELEITAVNNELIARGLMEHEIVKGEWTDAGTFDSLLTAAVNKKGRLFFI